MSTKQLEQVAQWERRKEDTLAQDFYQAQKHVQDNQRKLTGLQSYRLDYLRQLQNRANKGLGAMSFGQHQAFIDKLDSACTQQTRVLAQARAAAEQRKGLWLKQQQKRKAVEMLIDKKRNEQKKREDRQEQALLDEFATQRFVRKASNYQ